MLRIGTRVDIFNETQNGEVSDYMLNKKKVLSGSFKLGLPNNHVEQGFLDPNSLLILLR